MTKQFADAIYYNNERHLPISMSGKGLPHPHDYGLDPDMRSTACYRGFYCNYTIRQNYLWLTHLVVGHDGDYPQIGGVDAIYEEDRILTDGEADPEFLEGRWVLRLSSEESKTIERTVHYDGGIYANLKVPAPLTGGILLGIGDVDVPYIQYDFSHLSSYETVLELLFEQGDLVKTIDHSESIAAKRDELIKKEQPKYRSVKSDVFDADIQGWMRSTLMLEYKFLDIAWLREIYS